MDATVGHGDDLSYIFDAHDINGVPLETNKNLTEDDEIVRNIFTQMISDFVRYGSPRINSQEIKPFSLGQNNFIQIKPKPMLANNFKFCEMALWFKMADRLKSASCSFLDAFNKNIKNALTNFLNQNGQNQVAGLNNMSSLGEQINTPLQILGGDTDAGAGFRKYFPLPPSHFSRNLFL